MDLIPSKAQALAAVLTMESALDEAQALQQRIRQAEAAGQDREAAALHVEAGRLTERLLVLSAEINRTREAFMQEIHEVATATLAVMTRVAQMEVLTHGDNS